MIMWKIILACLAISDTRASVADNEVTNSIANNSSTGATITITMYAVDDEQLS